MEVFDLDPVAMVAILGMVAGIVELVKRVFDRDWKAVITIVGAGVAGALVSIPFTVSPIIGAVVGLAASGYITIAQNLGKTE